MNDVVVEKPKILVVDDYPTNLRVLLDSLKESGWRILVAVNGNQALQQADFVLPDIILLDVMMPEIDGFETCRRLKQNARVKDIPVIFMTALTDVVDKMCGFAAGGVDYITKPFEQTELLARVNVHLELKRTREQLAQRNQQLGEANLQLRAYQEQLEQLVRLDPLTNLLNRRAMLEHLTQAQQRAARNQAPFTVVLGDIDDFKRVNDNYGHDCGDEVLKAVANILRANVRAPDQVARWGGEEFLLLLPDTDVRSANIVMERIRAISAQTVANYHTHEMTFTMTFGLSASADDLETSLIQADRALYQGKHAGKNRVVMFCADEGDQHVN